MSDDRVTEADVTRVLDRLNVLPRQGGLTSEDVSIYFAQVAGMRRDAVLGCVDEILMTAKWFPVPSDLREAALDHARKMELGQRHDPAKGPCEFCGGRLWGPGAPVVRNGGTYDTQMPCEACAPLLYEKVVGINRDRKMQEGRTVTRDTSFPFKVGDKIEMCRDVLRDVEARAKAAADG